MVSLDHVRTFIAAADEGSFSAAARRLGRSQSAVSELIRAMEDQVGVALFDRTGRYPVPTAAAKVLLPRAREVLANIAALTSQAKGIASGVEPQVSLVVDVLFPIHEIAQLAKAFKEEFPRVPLHVFVDALGGTVQPILDQRAMIGIVGSIPVMPAGITTEPLLMIPFKAVAAADHPLVQGKKRVSQSDLSKHLQLILTDRTENCKHEEFGVFSAETWKLADLFAKHNFLVNGIGWGWMPTHSIEADLHEGRLVELVIEDRSIAEARLPMSVAYRSDSPPGPAGRWLIERLKLACETMNCG